MGCTKETRKNGIFGPIWDRKRKAKDAMRLAKVSLWDSNWPRPERRAIAGPSQPWNSAKKLGILEIHADIMAAKMGRGSATAKLQPNEAETGLEEQPQHAHPQSNDAPGKGSQVTPVHVARIFVRFAAYHRSMRATMSFRSLAAALILGVGINATTLDASAEGDSSAERVGEIVSAAPVPAPDYRLGPGDKLHIAVFGEPEITGDYIVDGSGTIKLPLTGDVSAAGRTTGQLQDAIRSKLADGFINVPRVSLQVTTNRPFYIIGAVNRPGEYPYVSRMTALTAVALAGGFAPTAVESIVYVRPEGSDRENPIPTNKIIEIHPGDVVRVETTPFWKAMSLFSPLTGVGAVAAASVH